MSNYRHIDAAPACMGDGEDLDHYLDRWERRPGAVLVVTDPTENEDDLLDAVADLRPGQVTTLAVGVDPEEWVPDPMDRDEIDDVVQQVAELIDRVGDEHNRDFTLTVTYFEVEDDDLDEEDGDDLDLEGDEADQGASNLRLVHNRDAEPQDEGEAEGLGWADDDGPEDEDDAEEEWDEDDQDEPTASEDADALVAVIRVVRLSRGQLAAK